MPSFGDKMTDSLPLLLKRYFGYETFRPLQREIMEANLTGKDVVAILPTGAGKSLCFQLPALAREGLTLIVSPLIALMKDQVDSLTASGVPATMLNSSVPSEESRCRRRGLERGEYKLLYAAPERIVSESFIQDLQRWNVTSIAIDEAHCISAWGHDFRPEYRKLAELRERLPGVPFMALTATATEQVRNDIIQQLQLEAPDVFLASFNRPNLSYTILLKQNVARQICEFVLKRADESGIIYAQSRKTAESLAAMLAGEGIPAVPYHAGLTPDQRSCNQESFIRDEVRTVCATIAFGMGINKPDVRYVIHADLPKNIEGYYQETGRAGRDGLPADCLLLYSRGDLVKNLRFLQEMTDVEAAGIASRQMRQMADFAEGSSCRRAALLGYFGEKWEGENCGGCDICLEPREPWDATTEAQKLMSCIFRIQKKSGFGTGLRHVIEVLAGADTEKIRAWGHDHLTTYGIGRETPKEVWNVLGRELIRRGWITTSENIYETLTVSDAGREALQQRVPFVLSRIPSAPQATISKVSAKVSTGIRRIRSGDLLCDEPLFGELRILRKRLADEREVPPYVVFGDISLRHMARRYPRTEEDFLSIPGVGAKKLADYGKQFLQLIESWLATHEMRPFPEERSVFQLAAPVREQQILGPSHRETLRLFQSGKTAAQIATTRGMSEKTIVQHLVQGVSSGEIKASPRDFYTREEENLIDEAVSRLGMERLAPLHEALGGRISYEKLHLYRAFRDALKKYQFSAAE
jgi:ATP-dependent DNA helicase RecQ